MQDFSCRTRLACFGIFALGVLLLMLVACGGDSQSYVDSGAPIAIAFPTPVPTLHPLLADLTPSQRLLLRIDYLSNMTSLLHQMRDINRGLVRLSDVGDIADVDVARRFDLDWVREVDQASRVAGYYYDFQYQVVLPDPLVEYASLHDSYALAIETSAIGVTSLLDASVFLGPSGRTYVDLGREDRARLHSYLIRAGFYLNEADHLISRAVQLTDQEFKRYVTQDD